MKTLYYMQVAPPVDPDVVLLAARGNRVRVVTKTGYRKPNTGVDGTDLDLVARLGTGHLVRLNRHQAAAVLAYARGRPSCRWAEHAAGAVMQYHKRETEGRGKDGQFIRAQSAILRACGRKEAR